jgi:uncharacterized protein (TIGR02391 family)
MKERPQETSGGQPPAESFVAYFLGKFIGVLAEIKVTRTGSEQSKDPMLSLNSLHPKIVESCRSLLLVGFHEEAVFRAFKTIEEEVRTRSCCAPTDFGVALFSKAMSHKSPILRFRTNDTEQEAVFSLFCGAIGANENPSSHRSGQYGDATRVLELLAFASYLMLMLDDADVAAT